jgi:hypothetical protein
MLILPDRTELMPILVPILSSRYRCIWPHNAYMFRSLKPFHFIIQILIDLPGISLVELLQSLSGLRKSTLLQRNNIQNA